MKPMPLQATVERITVIGGALEIGISPLHAPIGATCKDSRSFAKNFLDRFKVSDVSPGLSVSAIVELACAQLVASVSALENVRVLQDHHVEEAELRIEHMLEIERERGIAFLESKVHASLVRGLDGASLFAPYLSVVLDFKLHTSPFEPLYRINVVVKPAKEVAARTILS